MAGKLTSNVTAYIDGACRRNGRIGSRATYGIYIENNGMKIKGLIDSKEKQTNNTGELTAAIEVVNYAIKNSIRQIIVKSDSEYVIRGITKDVTYWKDNNWTLKSTSDPVKNRELWEKLHNLSKRVNVEWIHVKRESEKGQIIADRLARDAYDGENTDKKEEREVMPIIDTDIQNRQQQPTLTEETKDEIQHCSTGDGPVAYTDSKDTDPDTDETFVKTLSKDLCLMCDENCNDSLITCCLCKGKVHYMCSLLPGYFLNIIVKGRLGYNCYNCSKDEGQFKDFNIIDKLCYKNEALNGNVNTLNSTIDDLKKRGVEAVIENSDLMLRLEQKENSCTRKINTMKAEIASLSAVDINVCKEELRSLKVKLERSQDDNKKKDKTIKEMTKTIGNRESQWKEASDKINMMQNTKSTDQKHIEVLRQRIEDVDKNNTELRKNNESYTHVIDVLQTELQKYESVQTPTKRREDQTYAKKVKEDHINKKEDFRIECKFYKDGFCKNGEHCRFLHMDAEPEVAHPADEKLTWRPDNVTGERHRTNEMVIKHNAVNEDDLVVNSDMNSLKSMVKDVIYELRKIKDMHISFGERVSNLESGKVRYNDNINHRKNAENNEYKRGLCYNFTKTGYCKYGEFCRYSHNDLNSNNPIDTREQYQNIQKTRMRNNDRPNNQNDNRPYRYDRRDLHQTSPRPHVNTSGHVFEQQEGITNERFNQPFRGYEQRERGMRDHSTSQPFRGYEQRERGMREHSTNICRHYQNGFCRFGNYCKFEHC